MPVEPDSDDVFQDRKVQSDEEFLAQSRLQVGMAIGTGVLTIMLTTTIVVMTSQARQSIADGPTRTIGAESSYVLPIIPVPTPAPTSTAKPTQAPNSTATSTSTNPATPTKKPTTPPPTTPPPPTPTTPPPPVIEVASFTCQESMLFEGEGTVCTITLSAAPTSQLVVDIHWSTSDLSMDGSDTFQIGQMSTQFAVQANNVPELAEGNSRSTTIDLILNGSPVPDVVSITVMGVDP